MKVSYGTCEKSLLTKFIDKIGYFGDNSSLSGVRYVLSTTRVPLFKRLFWLSTLIVSCYCSASVLRASLGLYLEDAVNYSVETNYLDWDTPYPAITLCESPLSDQKLKELILASNNRVPISLTAFLKEVVYWQPKYCKVCVTCKINHTCVENFITIVDDLRLKCKDMLNKCWWGDEEFDCCEMFKPIETEYGKCYVFNSRLTKISIISVNRKVPTPNLVFTLKENVAMRIHSSDEMVSVALENILPRCSIISFISDTEIILKAEQTINDPAVKFVMPASRDCLFSHERPDFAQDWPYTTYSYSACVMYSRARAQVDVCNCTHHFMPKLGDFPPCGIKGLACLHTKSNLLTVEGLECPMDCENTVYTPIYYTCSRYMGNVSSELIKRGSRVVLRLGYLPSLRVRRHAIRDMLGLVVDVGGVLGVFIGASILSVIEVVYLLCIRRAH